MPLLLHEYNAEKFDGGCLAYLGKAENVAVTEDLERPYTLAFDYPLNDDKADMIQENRIVSVNGQGYRLTNVTRDYSGTKYIKAKATHVFFEDARHKHLPTIGNDKKSDVTIGIKPYTAKSTIGVDPYVVISEAVKRTKFELIPDSELAQMGMTRIGADGVKIDFFPTDKINVYDVVQSVIETYGHGEIYVDNYRFAAVERIGKDNGVRMSLKKNLTRLSVQRTTEELVTRVYPYGKDDLPISSVNGGVPYIENPEAVNKYGVREGYLDYPDYTDPAKVKAHAEYDLMGDNNDTRLDAPQLTISGDVVDLSKLAEYGDFYKIALGDTVHVHEKDIIHHKRIINITYYPFSSKQPAVTIGAPTLTNRFYEAWQKGKLFKIIQKNSTKSVNNKLKTSYFHGTVNSTQNPVRSENKKLLLDGDLLEIKDTSRIRIRLGNYNGEFVFIIYDKQGDRAVYLNEQGEAVYAGTIQTMKDCLIQGELRVGMAGSSMKGITFYGDAYEPDADGNYSKPYARILPYVANNEDFKGINVEDGTLCNFGKSVATESDIDCLQQQIDILKKQVDTMS